MDENRLGLYKKMKIEKVQKDLDEIQAAGEESILLIAERLEKELIDQGYKPGLCITLWHHTDCRIRVESGNNTIGGRF